MTRLGPHVRIRVVQPFVFIYDYDADEVTYR